MKLNLVSFDPSLSNWGTARAIYDTQTGALAFSMIDLQSTEPHAAKGVRKNCEDLDRARVLFGALALHTTGAQFAIAEVPVGSQSAAAMKAYGVCIGVLSACRIPLIPVTPTEVKLVSVGKKDASKVEMIEWATRLHPNLNWLTKKQQGKTSFVAKNEHMADAVAAMYAGIKSQQFKEILALTGSISS